MIIVRQRNPQADRSVEDAVKILDVRLLGDVPRQRGGTQAAGESRQIDERIET